jgi:hypothetical protein
MLHEQLAQWSTGRGRAGRLAPLEVNPRSKQRSADSLGVLIHVSTVNASRMPIGTTGLRLDADGRSARYLRHVRMTSLAGAAASGQHERMDDSPIRRLIEEHFAAPQGLDATPEDQERSAAIYA